MTNVKIKRVFKRTPRGPFHTGCMWLRRLSSQKRILCARGVQYTYLGNQSTVCGLL